MPFTCGRPHACESASGLEHKLLGTSVSQLLGLSTGVVSTVIDARRALHSLFHDLYAIRPVSQLLGLSTGLDSVTVSQLLGLSTGDIQL